MDLLRYFRDFFQDRQGVNPETDRFLVAVSGGKDSVTLACLFRDAGFRFGIAHVNHGLRGAASDGDERFVRELALEWGVPFFSQRMDTRQEAGRSAQSLQMTARNLRYAFLETTRAAEGFQWIATAHHLQDEWETFLLNLLRGTGLDGLKGIPARNGFVLRPLLGVDQSAIYRYFAGRELSFRADASNEQDSYRRNWIRHRITPNLLALSPGFWGTFGENLKRLQESHQIYTAGLEAILEQALGQEGTEKIIHWQLWAEKSFRETLLFEALRHEAFHFRQIPRIWKALDEQHTGRTFYSSGGWELLLDREVLRLRRSVTGGTPTHFIVEQIPFRLELAEKALEGTFLSEPPAHWQTPDKVFLCDASAVRFPLTVRKWQSGDAFMPLGMDGRQKKVQDLLTDRKLSRFDKEAVWILENGDGRIIWVIGLRADHRFRLTAQTKGVYEFRFS